MGTYGMLRISWPMFPGALKDLSFWIALLGAIAIIYGALVSMAQKDLKKLVAYSSVSHMGYCMLALGAFNSSQAIEGCMFQMLSHGLLTGAMFLLVGVLYDRAHTREIAAFGGLGSKLPIYTSLMVFFSGQPVFEGGSPWIRPHQAWTAEACLRLLRSRWAA